MEKKENEMEVGRDREGGGEERKECMEDRELMINGSGGIKKYCGIGRELKKGRSRENQGKKEAGAKGKERVGGKKRMRRKIKGG